MNEAFDRLVKCADSAMVVVTTSAEGEPAGCLVGFHSQSSIDPPHYSVWLSKANHTYRVALRSTHLAVHFLTSEDRGTAESFGTRSGENVDQFAGVEHALGPGAVPLLSACPNRLVVERLAILDDRGDHACFTGRVVQAQAAAAGFEPLRLSTLADLEPGHEADERAIDPSGDG